MLSSALSRTISDIASGMRNLGTYSLMNHVVNNRSELKVKVESCSLF